MSSTDPSIISVGIITLILAFNPGLARAGVVIEQKISVGNGGTPGSVKSRTLMLQDDKEKFQITDGITEVIDANDL